MLMHCWQPIPTHQPSSSAAAAGAAAAATPPETTLSSMKVAVMLTLRSMRAAMRSRSRWPCCVMRRPPLIPFSTRPMASSCFRMCLIRPPAACPPHPPWSLQGSLMCSTAPPTPSLQSLQQYTTLNAQHTTLNAQHIWSSMFPDKITAWPDRMERGKQEGVRNPPFPALPLSPPPHTHTSTPTRPHVHTLAHAQQMWNSHCRLESVTSFIQHIMPLISLAL